VLLRGISLAEAEESGTSREEESMKLAHLRTISAFAAIVALPALVRAQTTPASTISPTPVSPVSTTPDAGLYKIPPTTPIGMPQYSISPVPAEAAAETPISKRPMTVSDCINSAWQAYGALNFKTEAACQAWVKKHPAGVSRAPTPTKSPRATTRRTTPGIRVTIPPAETTPGSMITPLLDTTPLPR
jgi:hypothetical protein